MEQQFKIIDRAHFPADFMADRKKSMPRELDLFQMPARFMLDTNIVSYLLRDQKPTLKSRFLGTPPVDVAVSAITDAEVQFGVAKKPGAAKLRLAAENFLTGIAVLPWDSAAARAYGSLRAEQERRARPLSVEDLMIAAHALSLGLVLITNDQAFRFVEGLKTEDWTIP